MTDEQKMLLLLRGIGVERIEISFTGSYLGGNKVYKATFVCNQKDSYIYAHRVNKSRCRTVESFRISELEEDNRLFNLIFTDIVNTYPEDVRMWELIEDEIEKYLIHGRLLHKGLDHLL